MKFQATLQIEPATLSPEMKAAYNNYRLAFFQRAMKELDAKGDRKSTNTGSRMSSTNRTK